MNNLLQTTPFAVFLVLALGVLFLVSNWCIKDAIRRGKSPLLVFIAVIFFFPWGWIAWLIFRPDPIEPQKRPFDLQEYRQQ